MKEALAARITRARTHLLLDHPWFGSLALRLIVKENPAVGTIATDGTYLEFAPAWCGERTDEELVGLIAHEVMHCAMIHPYRMNGRDHALWNVAADIAINQIIRANGLVLPPTELAALEAKYADMNAEQIYAKLLEEKQQTGKSPKPDFGNHVKQAASKEPQQGSVGDDAKQGEQKAPSAGQSKPETSENDEGDGGMTEFDWQIEAESAAMVARKAGSMSGDVDAAIKQAREAKVDWRTVLRRFVENAVPSDYSWTQPNRRFISTGHYVPGVVKENTPPMVVAVDTSGSVSDGMLAQFAGEFVDIVREVRPERITVIHCDADIKGVEEFTPDDLDLTLKFKGRGGTRFQPVFDWLADQDEMPAALIYCTDMECYDQPVDPDIPVLWVAPEGAVKEQSFGELIRVPGLRY